MLWFLCRSLYSTIPIFWLPFAENKKWSKLILDIKYTSNKHNTWKKKRGKNLTVKIQIFIYTELIIIYDRWRFTEVKFALNFLTEIWIWKVIRFRTLQCDFGIRRKWTCWKGHPRGFLNRCTIFKYLASQGTLYRNIWPLAKQSRLLKITWKFEFFIQIELIFSQKQIKFDKFRLNSYQSFAGLDQRSIHAIHFVVESTSIAQIMAGSIATPQWGRYSSTIDTFSALTELEVHWISSCN